MLSTDSTVVTPGRFVFCPDDTPCFPGWHYLESRDWTSDERNPDQVLGEVNDYKRKWHSGMAPYPFPLAKVVGSLDCLAGAQPVVGLGDGVASAGVAHSVLWCKIVKATGDFSPLEGQVAQMTVALDQNAILNLLANFNFLGPSDIPVVFTVATYCPGGPPAPDPDALSRLQVSYLPFSTYGVLDLGTVCGVTGGMLFNTDSWGVLEGGFEIALFTAAPLAMPRKFIGGFDSRCYQQTPTPPPYVPDIQLRADQAQFAKAHVLLYDDPTAATAFVQDWLGPAFVLSTVPNSDSVVPGSIVAVSDELTIVIVSGTTSLEQVLTYSTTFLVGALDLGPFSTNPTWYSSALRIHDRIFNAGADPAGRIILCGHSYGGALCMLGAGAYLFWNPDRVVECLTFGAPKPGDARFIRRLEKARLVRISNQGDPIPSMPPRAVEVINFVGALGLPTVFNGWDIFRHRTGQLILQGNGEFRESDESTIDFDFVVSFVAAYLGSLPQPIPFPHSISEYLRRLRLGANP